MDNLSTEVGHKMRSAVKAKLIELGTGGSAGYIDDELPDYVMIMVANKRSKQQMTEDLNLFLNENTGEFVNWLHQVLQKLQEVAIPATAVVAKVKAKKPTDSTEKKDKKDKKKKLKRSHKSKSEAGGGSPQELAPPANQSQQSPPPASITDVFADHLIQKARTTISLEQSLTVKGKKEQSELAFAVNEAVVSGRDKSVDDFDIPTISEIAESAAVKVNRRKDISALADLQRKINQAKRQLKALGSEESEDEDFINIKDDGEEEELADADDCGDGEKSTLEHANDTQSENENPTPERSSRIPITFRADEHRSSATEMLTNQSATYNPAKKRSIMDRLGVRQSGTLNSGNASATGSTIVSLSAHRRSEQEIYVPTFRRKDDDRKSERERESRNQNRITKTTSRDPPAVRDLRDRVKERSDRKASSSHALPSKSARSPHRTSKLDATAAKKLRLVESRVFVAPPKPEYVEDAIEVPVNSVVKIQPRPLVPTNQQASKNLLMRAVAEAQRSTALIKPVQHKIGRDNSPTTVVVSSDRNQKLYTKSYRDRNSGLGKGKPNIVIEVASDITQLNLDEDDDVIEMSDVDEGYAYVPLNISSANSDDDMKSSAYESDSEKKNIITKTQFVVTLEDADKFAPRLHHRRQHHNRQQPIAIDAESIVPISVDIVNEEAVVKSEKISSPLTVEVTTQKVNRLIIQNDTEDEEELRKEVERSTTTVAVKPDDSSQPKRRSQKRRHVSPIKFDIKIDDEPKRPKSSGASPKDDGDHRGSKNGDEFRTTSTKRTESSRKYDNIPPLSSAITIADPVVSGGRSKSSDHCKYYPICGKGDKCEFTHPSTCKQFPNCKFGDQCLYFHPRCKFDLTCTRHGCNFSHTASALTSAAPPISSHVVPVTNYKSITNTPLPTMCKYYPKCTNGLCTFFHPKPCRFGKNCVNKVECNFYHFDLIVPPTKDKLKWVASSTVY